MIIAVDFDGTIVTHAYPEIGDLIPGAIDWLKRFQADGARLILWTMRSGKELEDAIDYLAAHDIVMDAANENYDPIDWTTSPKVYADIYIDDRNAGAPIRKPANQPAQVNWQLIGPNVILKLMKEKGTKVGPWQATSPFQKSPQPSSEDSSSNLGTASSPATPASESGQATKPLPSTSEKKK